MQEKDYAEIWRSEAQKRAAARPLNNVTAEIDIDGFKFIGRRLPLNEWTKAGRVPQALAIQALRVLREEQTAINADELSTDELATAVAFQGDAICYAVVKPKIVRHANRLEEGEVRYSEIFGKAPELIDKIMSWIFAGCPGVPVATKDGETDLKSVERFHLKSKRRSSSSARKDVSILPSDAERATVNPG